MPGETPPTATITVLRAGLRTQVVDYGRPHCRSLGVPVGGAADRTSLALGNAFVGNPRQTAALEITLAGPTLVADAPFAGVVYGAPFEIATDRRTLAPGRTFTLAAGEELRIGGTRERVRGYFCVHGGLSVPEVLGSRSGLETLVAGATLPCASEATGVRWFNPGPASDAEPRTLRVLPGRQAYWFATDAFYGRSYEVSPESDRMGLRLRGESLEPPQRELVSEPVCPGSVQVTRDGQCIVLGVDGQTIGGYPKVAQVISADLDKLGQLRPGEEVRFQSVSLDDAESVYREKQTLIKEWLTRLRVAAETG
jgi:5-oxoprolinase (ATP-hydrolysing) subunit C